MVDISAISGVASSLKATSDIAKAMLGVRDELLIREKAVELNAQIMTAQTCALAAQTAQAELVERVRNLEQQIVELEDWTTEKARYKLTEVAPGIFAYATKPEMEAGEPPHRICAGCYQTRRKSILQSISRSTSGGTTSYLRCNTCNAEVPIAFKPFRYSVTARRPRGDIA